ncbi:MAG: hypothetical protein WAT70_09410 [Rhizobiaceae bacterium]
MTEDHGKPEKNADVKAARKARLAGQLRENLKRRKQKAGDKAVPAPAGGGEPEGPARGK